MSKNIIENINLKCQKLNKFQVTKCIDPLCETYN
jgi:hypothetical protein